MTNVPCLVDSTDAAENLPQLWFIDESGFDALAATWPEAARTWLDACGFEAAAGKSTLLAGADGSVIGAVAVVGDTSSPFDAAAIVRTLPDGIYRLAEASTVAPAVAVLGFALDAYAYPKGGERTASKKLAVPLGEPAVAAAARVAEGVYTARDLVNLPANKLGPAELAERAGAVADRFGAEFKVIEGEDLLAQNYPAIHTVGRASKRAPRLIDIRWGDPAAPKVTLVGKGVCFDTGGLDLKPSSAMLLMKKDMGGAAAMLGLAQTLIADGLPIRLRLMIPAVENSVDGNAFRPGDVIDTRQGLTVEIGNTDAEGRLILADALTEADSENPELILDAATLTGAARVALGPALPPLFTPDDALANGLLEAGLAAHDPLWRMPLFEGYRKSLESPVADMSNTGTSRFAGAITAALFLQAFVRETKAWAHLDIYGYNPDSRPGRPMGGEATAVLALHRYLTNRYGAA